MACKTSKCNTGTTVNPLAIDTVLSNNALLNQNVNIKQRTIVFPLANSLVTNVRRVFVPKQTPQSFFVNRFFTGR